MSGNSFGLLFRLTTFGESHGKAIGVIVEGTPAKVPLQEKDIQEQLDKRKPGQSNISTPRKETDIVHILSGVFEGYTTGTPIMMILHNHDADPQAYHAIKNKFRPGHADYTYLKKYGIRDWRGSGRASGRETAARVAAGAIARKLLAYRGVSVLAYSKEIAGITCQTFDKNAIERNLLRAPDMQAAQKMQQAIEALKEEQNSAGGIIECTIKGVPVGLGEPVFDKIEALLGHAMLSIGAVKAIEFGSGFAASRMTAKEQNDQMSPQGFLSNNAGGMLGGISTGLDIIFRIAVKAPSSIGIKQKTITIDGKDTTIETKGRHDTCICPRIVPVTEAMTCIVLEDLYQRYEAYQFPQNPALRNSNKSQ
ncbi:hypothetical protein LSH36_793g01235 [Paralvinella palmiformis]|uniref:Chorismate synthase n=1 Tax=Paralvinella palmiformis TaxID=53620 RepID=A0AAD9MU78_9ANNE|nr:hypothetical protein LSH36_793g01235 [Paralvinella palmiformis]